jgi:hypothetical protein
MNWFERCLFPRSGLVNFVVIVCISTGISFLLVGRQIFHASWGIIDDHEVFYYLGPRLRLPLSDIWSTLLAKTEVGTLLGRFRPSFYLFKVIETSIFGPDVHLWYLGNTIAFAICISSAWWVLRRFVGGWLGGVLAGSIALLPLWSGIWSRLGPSEIYGAACIGIMLFATDFVLFSDNLRARVSSAIVLAVSTLALVGMKETFIPLAGGTAVIFILAWTRKRLPLLLIVLLSMLILACLGGISLVVLKQMVSRGTDFYGNSAGPWPTIKFGIIGVFDALLRTWWIYTLPIVFFQILHMLPSRSLGGLVSGSREAVGVYCFVVAMYAAQCALYRSSFPHNMRYDFPAMLLVPLTCCILVSEISRKAQKYFPERTIDYAQLTAAGFVFFALVVVHLGKLPALVTAVQTNIEVTNRFYNELQRLVSAAKESPDSPIILDAYGPLAYEPVWSLSYFIPALGAKNRISVRFHSDEKLTGTPDDGLQQSLSNLQEAGSGGFTPLAEALADRSNVCLSVGIEGPPDAACSGFPIRLGPAR